MGSGKFEALVNDVPLKVSLNGSLDAVVEYNSRRFNFSFINSTNEFFGQSSDSDYIVDVIFNSKTTSQVTIVNRKTMQIDNWILVKMPRQKLSAGDAVFSLVYFVVLFYLGYKAIKSWKKG